MNIDPKAPSASIPSNVRQLLVLLTAEGYRPDMVQAAIGELGAMLAGIYVQQVVNADPRHETPALDKALDRERLGNDLVSEELLDIANAEVAKLRRIIKEQQEQMARTEKVLADSEHGVKQILAWNKRLDELQAENKRLQDEIQFRNDEDAGADL